MRAALDFISKDVKQYMEQNNLDFNDFESAALIYNSGLPVTEIHKRLEELATETKDAELKEQIMEILSVEKEDIKAFHENTEGFVYVVAANETPDEPCGYFAAPETAYYHGMKLDGAFGIDKYQVVGRDGTGIKKSKGYFNPYMMPQMSKEELVTEDEEDGRIASQRYTQDGILQSFWSQEIERDDEDTMKRLFDPSLFKNAFINMPNPFEKGDIVRLIPDGCHGVVDTSQADWMEFLKEVDFGKFKACDFGDASIIVECVSERGYISHDHFPSVFLEKYEPQEGEDDYEVLVAASDLLRGSGGLDWFLHQYDAYKEKCRMKNGE